MRALHCILPLAGAALLTATHAFAQEPLTSTFDEDWLKSVVSIEVLTSPTNSQPIGTGFFLLTPSGRTAVLTAKHVVVEPNTTNIRRGLAYRLNTKDASSYLLNDDAVLPVLGKWILSTNADVAIRLLSWASNSVIASLPVYVMLARTNIQAGAPIIVLGFPMGLRSEDHPVPILRKGVIARSDPGNLIADCFVFPGNSGGPVFYLPYVRIGVGFKNPMHNEQKLLGLVSSEISYVEDAYSPQTLRKRITFEENSGLCNVVPTDSIRELMDYTDFKRLDNQ